MIDKFGFFYTVFSKNDWCSVDCSLSFFLSHINKRSNTYKIISNQALLVHFRNV